MRKKCKFCLICTCFYLSICWHQPLQCTGKWNFLFGIKSRWSEILFQTNQIFTLPELLLLSFYLSLTRYFSASKLSQFWNRRKNDNNSSLSLSKCMCLSLCVFAQNFICTFGTWLSQSCANNEPRIDTNVIAVAIPKRSII